MRTSNAVLRSALWKASVVLLIALLPLASLKPTVSEAYPGSSDEYEVLTDLWDSGLFSETGITDTVQFGELSLGTAITVHLPTKAFVQDTVTQSLAAEVEPVDAWYVPVLVSSVPQSVLLVERSSGTYHFVGVPDVDLDMLMAMSTVTQSLLIDLAYSSAAYEVTGVDVRPMNIYAGYMITPTGTLTEVQSYMVAREAAAVATGTPFVSGGGIGVAESGPTTSAQRDASSGQEPIAQAPDGGLSAGTNRPIPPVALAGLAIAIVGACTFVFLRRR